MQKSDGLVNNDNKGSGSFTASFKLRVLLYLLPPVLLVSGILSFLVAGFAGKIIAKNDHLRVERRLESISQDMRNALFVRDFPGLAEILQKAFGPDEVRSLVLKNDQNQEILTFELQAAPADGLSTLHKHQLMIRGPQGADEVWVLEISMLRSSSIMLLDLFMAFQLLMVLTMTLGVVVGIFWVFEHLVFAPLHKIQDSLKAFVKDGTFSPVIYEQNDEIGETISWLNLLMASGKSYHEMLAHCLDKSKATLFEYDAQNDSFKFLNTIIAGTDIETEKIKNSKSLLNLFNAEEKVKAEDFWATVQKQIANNDSGHASHVLSILAEDKELGKITDVCLKLSFCWLQQGNKKVAGGVFLNLAAEKNKENALQNIQAEFRHLLDHISVGIWRSQGDIFVYMNKTMAKMIGYSDGNSAIQQIRSITHELFVRHEDHTFFHDEIKKEGRVKDFEFKFRRCDDTTLWGLISGHIYKEDGKIFVEGSLVDITAKKEAEEIVRKHEKDMRMSLEAAGTAAYCLSLHDGKLYLCGAAERLLGCKAEDMVSLKDFQKIIHPDDLQLFPPDYALLKKQQQKSGKIESEIELRICIGTEASAIETRWLGISFAYMAFGSHNRPTVQHGLLRDITQRKSEMQKLAKEKQEAVAANRQKSEFFADISHEIRTPLNAIIGFSELLVPSLTGTANENYVDSILTASRSLLNVINDILDLAKLEAGKLVIVYEPVSVEVLARETSALFSSQAESKGLEFITQVDESVPSILLFDSLRIRQVVNNLVANAIKFTDQGHVAVYFSASPSENKNSTILNISIEDTGSGISHSEREVIFKPFVQKRGQKLGGTGLGLAISKRLIESMNGTISLRSEPGKGCKFEVSFKDIKVERLTKDLEPQSDKKARNFQFEKQKVLVVDDARSNRELLTEALSAVGLTVWAADDGQQAIDMAQKYEPELIIMDIRMPVKDGVQAAKEIKAIMKVPIIALTASLSATQEQLTTVFDGYLHKPVKLYDLFSESGRFLEFSLGSQIKSGEHKSMEPSVEAFEQVVAPRELAKKIGQNLLKKIDEFSGAFCISDIKDFASELKIMAKKHSFNLLALEADSLYQAAGHYDTMLIKSSVKRINKILSLFLNFFQQNP